MAVHFVESQREALKYFTSRGFRHFKNEIVIDQEKRIRRHFSVFSSGRPNKVLQLLFHKWLYNELKQSELELLFSFKSFLDNPIMFSSFRARSLGIPKKVIRRKLKILVKIGIEFKILNYLEYKGLQGNLIVSYFEGSDKLPRTKPYSGYTKHYKDKGSLGTGVTLDSLEPSMESFDIESFILDFLLSQRDSLPLLGGTLSSE